MGQKYGIVKGNDGKGLIGYIWLVDGDKVKLGKDKARITRLELFSHSAGVAIARENDPTFELKSLFLDSCPGTKSSYVEFKEQASGPLYLVSEDGSRIGVNGSLKIVTRLRSALFFRTAEIQLEFLLDSTVIDTASGSVICAELRAFRNRVKWTVHPELGEWVSAKVEDLIDSSFSFEDDFLSGTNFTPPLVHFKELFEHVLSLPAPIDASDHHARWSVGYNRFHLQEPEEKTFDALELPERMRFGPSATFLARSWRGTPGNRPIVLPFEWQYEGGFYDQKSKLSLYGSNDYDIRLSAVAADDNSSKLELEIFWQRKSGMSVKEGPLNLWNDNIARPYIESLDSVKRGTPGSVMPVFGLPKQSFSEPDTVGWSLNFELTDSNPHTEDVDQSEFSIRFCELTVAGTKNASILCHLPNFKDHRGEGIVRAVRIETPSQKIERSGMQDKAEFSLALVDCAEKLSSSNAQVSRAGALDLSFMPAAQTAGTGNNPDVPQGHLRATARGVAGGMIAPFGRAFNHDLRLELFFRLDSFAPGGQDPAPPDLYLEPDERQTGLLLPYPINADGTRQDWAVPGPFVLVCKESSPAYASHSLELRLERQTVSGQPQVSKAASIDMVVLDFSPFLIGRVQASAKWTDEIGNWSSRTPDEASWELGDLGEGMKLLLPPQSVGEEFLRTYDDAEQKNRESKTILYTFSPMARAEVLRSPFAQSFSEAPWNLRRLLGYSGQRMPGAELSKLAFELLYGLEINISAEGLLLAEFGARVGKLPGRLREESSINMLENQKKLIGKDLKERDFLFDEYTRVRKEQNRWLDQLARRLALLEPWSRSSPKEQLKLANGVVCEIRESRASRPYFNTDRIERVRLKGGFDWAFESKNIYNEVISVPRSVSAYIENPSLSALGGSGYQEASYAKEKTKVYANTYLGRTFFYSLERKGRIGCLWNKAKHVIIYERTVADTEQFPSKELDSGGLPLWQGRAMVRKVREFVEILEPERSYEDNAKFTGCVLSSRFGQKVIPVDSAWGHDIDRGWVVPLYKECAGPYYKPPAIYLKMAVADKSADGFVWGRLCQPQKLVFYTNTDKEMGADSDSWPAVLGVDFPLCLPKKEEEDNDAEQNGRVCPVPVGMDRFTYSIDTGGKAVDLLKHRQANAVEALISNVTLVRRTARDFDPKVIDQTKSKFLALSDNIEKARTGVLAVLERAQTQVEEDLSKALDTTGLSQEELKKILDGSRFKDELAYLKAQAKKEIDNLKQPFVDAGKSIDVLLEQQDELLNAWKAEFEHRVVDWIGTAEKSIQLEEVLRKKQIAQIEAELKSLLQSAEHAVGDVARSCEQLAAELDSGVEAALAFAEDAVALLERIQKQGNEKEYYIAIARLVRRLEQQVSESRQQMGPYFQALLEATIKDATGQIKKVEITAKLAELEKRLLVTSFSELAAKLPEIKKQLDEYTEAWEAGQKLFKGRFIEDANSVYKEYLKCKKDIVKSISESEIASFIDKLSKLTNAGDVNKLFEAELGKKGENLAKLLKDKFEAESTKWSKPAARVYEDIQILIGDFAKVSEIVDEGITQYIDRVEAAIEALSKGNGLVPYRDLDEVRKELAATLGHSVAGINTTVRSYERLIEDKYRRYQYELSKELEVVKGLGSQTLSLVRAYGKAPIADSLRLDRDKLAYHFKALNDVVDFTPAKVLVNGAEKLANELKSLSISLPSASLGSQFISKLPKEISLGEVLPDFSGVKIAKLLEGVKFPLESSENVKIKHGFDEQTKRAWVKTDVLVPVGEQNSDGDRSVQLFELGPVKCELVSALFEAHSSISVDTSGTTSKSMDASISGSWNVSLAKRPLLTFKKTKLEFDSSGRSRFKLDSKNVEVHPPLNFIAELLDKCKMDSSSGVTFELTRDPRGIPTGARALLNLALPAVQTGAFSISNLSLSANFGVAVEKGEFRIGAGLSLASKNRPFIMTVLFLGGGGWFTVETSYSTAGSGLSGRVSLGISVGAAFAFNISVARGGVYMLFSVELDWAYGGGDGGLTVRLRFSLSGEIVILKIVSASITLALEAEYESGGTVNARGILDISIKICWCFTVSVNKKVEFKLAGKDKQKTAGLGAQPAGAQPLAIAGISPMPAAASAGNNGGTTAGVPDPTVLAETPEQIVSKAIDRYFSSFGDD